MAVLFPAEERTFLFSKAPKYGSEFHKPLIQRVPGKIFEGVKRPECETDHSNPPSTEVENEGI
jgi:hypothetical protein